MTRSRRAVMATTTGSYLAHWPAMVGGALVGCSLDRSHGERLEWDGLGGLVYGSFAGLVAAHVAWAVVVWRMLRPQSPPSGVGAVIAFVPLLIVATVVVLASSPIQGGPLVGWMIAASAVYPAAPSRWVTARWDMNRASSLEPGAG